MNSARESSADDHVASQATLPSVPSVASIDTVSCAVDSLDNHYELYGVVNHLGGMYGGHYVAMAKCEQIVLPTPSTTSNGNGNGAEDAAETVTSNTNSGSTQRTPIAFQDYVYSHGGGSLHPVQTKKWLKFDDEFVLEVSNTNNPIETAICTGKLLCCLIGAVVDC